MASTSLFRFQKAFWLNGLSLSLYLSFPAPDGLGHVPQTCKFFGYWCLFMRVCQSFFYINYTIFF